MNKYGCSRSFGSFHCNFKRLTLPYQLISSRVCYSSQPRYQQKLSAEFLKDIVSQHEQNGRKFLLPLGDETVIRQILEPLEKLNLEGVKLEFMQDALSSNPELFSEFTNRGKQLVEVLDILVGYAAFTFESALQFYHENIGIFRSINAHDASCRLAVLTNFGILAGPQLRRIIKQCPELLCTVDAEQIQQFIDNVLSFFSRKELTDMLIQTPHIVLLPFEDIELKYEYIFFHMKIEPSKLSTSLNWMNLTLEEIMERHQFLQKTGKYILPDPKRPQLEKDNPPSHRIFDSDSNNFAVQVAGVTPEEWNAFKCISLMKRQLSDQEQPFERVKPSVRRAYERRAKTQQLPDELLESGS